VSLWVLQNGYTPKVLADLRSICPDPGLSIDGSGRITYVQTMSGVGCDTLALLDALGTVGIRGESSAWSARPKPKNTLADIAGTAVHDRYPDTRRVDVVYDASDCNGHGFVTVDPSGVLIGLPSDALLFHELAHAAQMFLRSFNPLDPEPNAIFAENAYRATRGLPSRGGWAGGCRGTYTPSTGGATQPTSSSQRVASTVCAPLLVSFPQAIGTTHTFSSTELTAGEASYLVDVNNQTTDTFSEIVVFYKRLGLPGVVYLSARDVGPGKVSSFVCGLCKDFESYVVGFFLGPNLVAQIPGAGNMTPALASQLNPTDVDPCIDAWMITSG
jgi:hypothetical protein